MRRYKLKKMKRVHGLHFAPCGTRLLACGGAEVRMVDGAVLLDLASGEPHARIDQFGTCYAVPPDTTRFALGGANQWNTEMGGVVWADLPDLAGWNRQTWKKRSLPPQYTGVYGLAFDPTGTRLAVAHLRTTGRRWNALRAWVTVADPDTGEPRIELPTNRVTSALAFTADGARLAVTGGTGGDPRVTVYDLAARVPLSEHGLPGASTLALRYHPDGRLTAANGRTVFVLRADGGQQFALGGHTQQVNALAVMPDGARLLSASHDGTVRAWDLRTGNTVAEFDWKIGPVTALACAPDGLTCAAAGTGGQVVLWDADS